MTANELLDLAHSQGVELFLTAGGGLGWCAEGGLPDDLRQLLVENKAELLAALSPPVEPDNVVVDAGAEPPPTPPATTLSDRTGRALRELHRLEADHQAGRGWTTIFTR
jgi:hypothetical protein